MCSLRICVCVCVYAHARAPFFSPAYVLFNEGRINMAVYQNTGIRQAAHKSRKLGSMNVVDGI